MKLALTKVASLIPEAVCMVLGGALVLFIWGCKNPAATDGSQQPQGGGSSEVAGVPAVTTQKSATTYAVVVGMENSRFAGACPGAGIDAKRFAALIGQYTDNVVYLPDAKATRTAVTAALKSAVENAELTVFYYSGHGGSEDFGDTGAEEEDGQDEFLCLYDTYLRDNDIWKIISKSKGRVWMMYDACHSCSMYRAPANGVFPKTTATKFGGRRSGITFGRFAKRNGFKVKNITSGGKVCGIAVYPRDTHYEEGDIRMLCWSGCPDDTYSYGSSTGGEFTNCLLRRFNPVLSYDELWNAVESDRTLKYSESVQRTIIGTPFGDKVIFK